MAFELLTESPWVSRDQSLMAMDDCPWPGDEKSMLVVPHDPMIEREAADDWPCERPGPVTAVSWYGSYQDYAKEACACEQVSDPPRPDYFLLSIYENAALDQSEPYDHPGTKIWEFRAYEFAEIRIGSKWRPAPEPNEVVFRYNVRLPEPDWFMCDDTGRTLWFSVKAVYEESPFAYPYFWLWTARVHTFGTGAKWKDVSLIASWPDLWWPTGSTPDQDVDMCFTLYTAPLPPGPEPVAYWPFDEDQGTIAHDAVGGHHATVHNTEWQAGKINGALHFNGFDAYVDMGISDILGPEFMTLCMWIRPSHMGGVRYIANRSHIIDDLTDYSVLIHGSRRIEFVFDERMSGAGSVTSMTQVALEEWTHIAVTRSPAEGVLYINGVPEEAKPYQSRSTGHDFQMTISSHRGSTRFFNGKIDDVRLYDSALTPDQISGILE
jgi:hypothetical protein